MTMTTTRQLPPESARHCGTVEKTEAPVQSGTSSTGMGDENLNAALHRWLARHNITLLRVSMGAVIFGFGVLKYFPGVSPAESLILATTHLLTFGLIPDYVAMILLATAECTIGLSLMLGRGLRVTRYLLVLWTLGILSPAVLLAGRLFMGPYHAPTLEGQYVLKDIVLLTASLVIASTLSSSKKDTGRPPTPASDEGG